MSLRPICVKCGKEMVCQKNSVVVWHPIEPIEGNPMDAIDFVTYGDKYKCPSCGIEVIVDCGDLLMTPPYKQSELKETIVKAEEAIQIRRRI